MSKSKMDITITKFNPDLEEGVDHFEVQSDGVDYEARVSVTGEGHDDFVETRLGHGIAHGSPREEAILAYCRAFALAFPRDEMLVWISSKTVETDLGLHTPKAAAWDADALAQEVRDALMRWQDGDISKGKALDRIEAAWESLDDGLMAGGSLPTFWERLGEKPAEYVMETRINLGAAVEATLAPDITIRGLVIGHTGPGLHEIAYWHHSIRAMDYASVVKDNIRVLP